jgi:hypothetical protein
VAIRALIPDVVLPEELDVLVDRGAIYADLRALEQAEAIFETDHGAVVPIQTGR